MHDGLSVLRGILADRGLSVRVKHDGAAYLVGPSSEVTPALREMMAIWRAELIEGVSRDPEPPPPPPTPRLREWQWPNGTIIDEDESFCSVGDPSQHPGRAIWWRYVGEAKWQVIPGREHLLHERNRPASTTTSPEAMNQETAK